MRIAFVCTGNTCRSIMAEALTRKVLHQIGDNNIDIKIISAGLMAFPGSPASEHAVKLMAGWGIDISSHGARQFTEIIADEADLILTMTIAHKRAIIREYPHLSPKVFTLGEYAETGHTDIIDPFGQPMPVYGQCAEEIRVLVERVIHRILDKGHETDKGHGVD